MAGMQATDSVADFAVRTGKPFAVVPCCVFPRCALPLASDGCLRPLLVMRQPVRHSGVWCGRLSTQRLAAMQAVP